MKTRSAPGARACRLTLGGTAAAGAAAALVAGLAAAAPAMAAPLAGQAAATGQTTAAAQTLAPPAVFGWGSDFLGALGVGSRNDQRAAPTPIALPPGVRQVSAGRNAWSSAAVLANGTVAAWGSNGEGQLGDGTTTERDSPVIVPGLTGITQVATGAHTLALDSSGRVWAWGEDLSGELGNGTHNQPPGAYPSPALVPGLTGVTSIAVGDGFSLALRSDGTVWTWGWNREGELGDGTTADKDRPEQVPGLSGITAVAVGDRTSYAVRADGTVLAWGDNTNGLLGNGTVGGFSASPVQVPGLTGVTQIASDANSTLAVAGPAGTVWAWGNNTYGELGDGTTTAHYTPEQIGLSGVRQVTTSELANMALRSNGTVLTWGDNDHGELGTGTVDSLAHPSPVLVRTLAGVSQISGSLTYVLAIGSRAPQIPSLIGDTQAEAAQDLQATGFVLGHVSVVVDLSCEYIGAVKAQSPAAGTYDPPGTSVSIAIGKAGGKCL